MVSKPFDKGFYPRTSIGVRGVDSNLQEHLQEVKSLCLSQVSPKKVEILSPEVYSHIHPLI